MTLILSGTDGLSDVDGTAATPAIRGTDANTGIFFGTDIIGFSEGGAEAMRIDSSGNLLVGTTSALAPSSGRGNITVNGSTDAILAFGVGAATAGYIYQGPSSLIVNTQGAKAITFESSGVERGRFSETGALVLQGGNTTANGIGITFPATQSASSDANTLDDYEEGTWTPNQGNALTVVGAFSSSGTYTKIGRQVTVLFAIAGATTIAVTAGAQITGNLPFTAAASMDTAGTIYRFGATGGECIAGGSQVNAFSGAAISAGGGLNISITYFV